MKKLRVGVIGIGDISNVYLNNLKKYDAVEVVACASRGLFCLAFDLSSSHFFGSSAKRTAMEFACASRCSLCASAMMSCAYPSSASRVYSMTLVFFRKVSVDSGEKKRAVPEVGRTWHGPAI